MNHQLKIFNSLKGEKEVFVPLHENNVGMYVCGPTVYSNVHLTTRSEERRVGKECRSRWSPYH